MENFLPQRASTPGYAAIIYGPGGYDRYPLLVAYEENLVILPSDNQALQSKTISLTSYFQVEKAIT